MKAREMECSSEVWKSDIEKIKPFIMPGGSDSAELDNALELMGLSSNAVLRSISRLIPEAYEKDSSFNSDLKSFYENSSCFLEPWDGPAALVFTNGNIVGAALDRNGLRPVRYHITKDNMIILGSEAGMVNIDPSNIIRSGRIAPGKMIAVDSERKILLSDTEIKSEICSTYDYNKWCENNIHSISEMINGENLENEDSYIKSEDLLTLQKAFGYSLEDLERLFEPMSLTGKEPIGSMGDDTPIAALSSKPQSVFNYFKQSFAQVTNPPIDPYREDSVMSLRVILGDKSSFFDFESNVNKFFYLDSPVLTSKEINFLSSFKKTDFKVCLLYTSPSPRDS